MAGSDFSHPLFIIFRWRLSLITNSSRCTMYTLKQKNEISRRLADPGNVECLRRMLAARNCRLSTVVMSDRRQLSENLIYTLLSYCTEEEIVRELSAGKSEAAVIRGAGIPHDTGNSHDAVQIKKKETKGMNILISGGQNLKTKMSRLLKSSTLTESTHCAGSEKSSLNWPNPRRWLPRLLKISSGQA